MERVVLGADDPAEEQRVLCVMAVGVCEALIAAAIDTDTAENFFIPAMGLQGRVAARVFDDVISPGTELSAIRELSGPAEVLVVAGRIKAAALASLSESAGVVRHSAWVGLLSRSSPA